MLKINSTDIQSVLTLAQAISESRSESELSEVDFRTSSASVVVSHSDKEAASFLILRASWDALSRSCFPSVTYKKIKRRNKTKLDFKRQQK